MKRSGGRNVSRPPPNLPALPDYCVRLRRRRRSTLDEGQQVGVQLVLVGRGEAVRRALVDLQPRSLDQLVRGQRRGADGHDLIVVAVDEQRRYVELLQILRL